MCTFPQRRVYFMFINTLELFAKPAILYTNLPLQMCNWCLSYQSVNNSPCLYHISVWSQVDQCFSFCNNHLHTAITEVHIIQMIYFFIFDHLIFYTLCANVEGHIIQVSCFWYLVAPYFTQNAVALKSVSYRWCVFDPWWPHISH